MGRILRHIRYHGTRHPSGLGEGEIVAYLTYLAWQWAFPAARRYREPRRARSVGIISTRRRSTGR